MKVQPEKYGLYESRNEHDACGIGAVVNIDGSREHNILELGNRVVMNLQHRGAAGGDGLTGDGAGILFQLPHEFFREESDVFGFTLPRDGEYGVGMVFLPTAARIRRKCEGYIEKVAKLRGLNVLGWRDVPGDNSRLGELAKSSEPVVRQVFFDGSACEEDLELELFLARKKIEKFVSENLGEKGRDFYIASMSCRTICYKGMFLAPQLFGYYPDLSDQRMKSAIAIVHQRYSTNTFPNWRLAQPFRCIAHNGEINTLSGNINRMKARERLLGWEGLRGDPADLLPVLSNSGSDSEQFDNALELLVRAGRSMPHAIMMMIPEAFGPAYHISRDKRAFYEYHAAVMEPWDGPAAMVFTDGKIVGGTLDRNGLRPARYIETVDGQVVLASEAGVMDIPPGRVKSRGRLKPGKMFLVDTESKRVILDNEIKGRIARQKPYRRWLESNRIELRGLFESAGSEAVDPDDTMRRMNLFGYTREELEMVIRPMAINGQEPIGSMGTDTPLAVLSDRPVLLYDYFKQRFAQVTNPPIDPLREGLVMTLMSFAGKQKNLLSETPSHCRQLKLSHPILTNEDMMRLRNASIEDFSATTVDALFEASNNPGKAMEVGLKKLLENCIEAIESGASLIIISDRNAGEKMAPIPSLLATSAVQHGLLEHDLRGAAGLIIETGDAREVMHHCLLCGYGADAVNPYMAFEAMAYLQNQNRLPEKVGPEEIVDNYIAAIKKGILKTMSKMGISTLRSYRAAQLFQAIGLELKFVDRYFPGTDSPVGGTGIDSIAADVVARHNTTNADIVPGTMKMDFGGEYHYRKDGRRHLWNPEAITSLQKAVRNNDAEAYSRYARMINNQSRKAFTLRGLFDFKKTEPVDLEKVEPAESIVKRFCTGAMSHGSISKEAHETIAAAMNKIGAMSNTGEGGEDPARYTEHNGDSLNSAIKQVASARFGVTAEYLSRASMIQIKMAQGAKPGEGGQLPGHKVTEEIAKLRHSTPGVTLISPPPHHDIYSIEDLAQLIYDLKCAKPGVPVSVKLVSETGVGTVAAGVAKGGADEVLISGHDGGTGASPLSSIKRAGAPWELGLAETQQTLMLNGLRSRIRIQVDGQLRTGRDVVVGALLGAEQFGFGTAALVSLGCIMMRKCHLGTCPVGIGTQSSELRCKFRGKPEHLARYMLFVAEEVRSIMSQLGFRKFEDMVGRVDLLVKREAIEQWKARGLDFTRIFAVPNLGKDSPARQTEKQPQRHDDHLDWQILDRIGSTIDSGKKCSISVNVANVHRCVGTIVSNRIVTIHGSGGLPDGTVEIEASGTAGQSFGAFLVPGITLRLTGDSNDYLGKGLSGGRIVTRVHPDTPFRAQDNIIVGNAVLYGATGGEVFLNGLAGERFAVRNSGATAVVEGVGDHGCEYMTGGIVTVLGKTGCNFAAGMSGGIAFVLDEHQLFDTLCNLDMVNLEAVWHREDAELLKELVKRHYHWTGSSRAKEILDRWSDMLGQFVKVIPIDYQRALQRLKDKESRNTETTAATEEVFNG